MKVIKKFYGYFTTVSGKEFVIMFRVADCWKWDPKTRAFTDDRHYVKSEDHMIELAAYGAIYHMVPKFIGCIISHEEFIRQRSYGIPRWNPEREVIN